MACNCLCCGCQNCTEAQEGKCCCGGSSGTCCQPGEFCCSGVCVEGGCACASDADCCVCGAVYFDPTCGDCPDGWTKSGPFEGECYCFSPTHPFRCGEPQSAECAAIEAQFNAAVAGNAFASGTYSVGSGGHCCSGACQDEPCPDCVAWMIAIDSEDFPGAYGSGTRSTGCLCDDLYEVQGGPFLSVDETQEMMISGAMVLACVDGECQVSNGGFCVEIYNVSDNSLACYTCYEAATGAITSLPHAVSFSVSDDTCSGSFGSLTSDCVINGPLPACDSPP